MAIRTPAPTATTALAPASRAIAQVSGAAVAPIRTKGAADAHGCGPNRARNGTWTSAASGIQWPNAGIGRVGSAGIDAADLGEDPDDVDVEPATLRNRARSIDVVVGVGIPRVRIGCDEGRPDEEGKHVQDDGGTHGRCSVAPGPRPADRYRSGLTDTVRRRAIRGHCRSDASSRTAVPDAPALRLPPRWPIASRSNERRLGPPPVAVLHLVAFALPCSARWSARTSSSCMLTTDPAADVHAYYEAGARLNAGQPLYEQSATVEGSHYYFYPPLLAVAFRPLALLPFEVAAAIWMASARRGRWRARSGSPASATDGRGTSSAGWPRRSPGASSSARRRSWSCSC